MKEIIKNIIRDFHNSEPVPLIERELQIPLNSKKIIALIGPRRAGKTYYLFQLINNLKTKTDYQNIIYINFDDERLKFNTEDLASITDAYYELYPEHKSELFFFFDEIQNVPDWEKFVSRIYSTVTKNIFLTGSSAKLLSKEIATGLRGRAISYEISTLSFMEYLKFRGINSPDPHSTKGRAIIINNFNDYLLKGGYPETISYGEELRIKTLQSYLDVMIFRDIIERYNISNVTSLRYFINKSLANSANYVTVNKFYNELKSMGIKISKDYLYEFFYYINDCYLMFQTNKYSESVSSQNISEKKLYTYDNGLAAAASFKFSENKGRMLENLIARELRYSGKEFYYFKGKNECDFVVKGRNKIDKAIQVSLKIDSENSKRELAGLYEAMDYFKLKEGTIITLDQSKTIEKNNSKIEIIPAWKWNYIINGV